uniref:Zinc finger protein 76 n=1 Tax=Micrurus lemniscatus lemniscatus TaxID=129467 RepID=A0A2D4IZW1_MICLE
MESLSLQAMTLSDGTTAYVQQDAGEEKLVDGQMIELEDGSTAFFQQVTLQKESITFEDGQPVTLEDGTMAFIHHTPKEGFDPNTLEAIQLEDGSTAFIHRPVPTTMDGTILAMQADVGLEELAEKKDDSFDLNTDTTLKDYTSKVRIFCFSMKILKHNMIQRITFLGVWSTTTKKPVELSM